MLKFSVQKTEGCFHFAASCHCPTSNLYSVLFFHGCIINFLFFFLPFLIVKYPFVFFQFLIPIFARIAPYSIKKLAHLFNFFLCCITTETSCTRHYSCSLHVILVWHIANIKVK